MDDTFYAIIILVLGVVFGGIIGYSAGSFEAKEAIAECQKELPRNVNCKIIAVPVDKN
jgi:hypothetical protein